MKLFFRMAFVLSVLLLAYPVFAQDTTPNLPPLDLTALLAQVVAAVLTILVGWISSPAVVAVVAFLKRWLPNIPAEWLAAGTSIVLMVILAIAAHFGLEAQLRQALNIITAILTVLAGATITLVRASTVYNTALEKNTALVGYQRTGTYANLRAALKSESH